MSEDKTTAPQPDEAGQETYTVTITPAWYDKREYMHAVHMASQHQGKPATINHAWQFIEIARGQMAQVLANHTKLPNSIQIESRHYGQGVRILETVGMISVVREGQSSEVGDAEFEIFWSGRLGLNGEEGYPKRNGLRVGKAEARTVFMRTITTRAVFDELMLARENYRQVCGDKPKDAARFLRNDVWREYLSIEGAHAAQPQRRVSQSSLNAPGKVAI